ESLAYRRFFLPGHDPGARVSPPLCFDHPDRINKVCIFDVLPRYYVWAKLKMKSGLNSSHSLVFSQPGALSDTLISAVFAEWFLKSRGYNNHLPKIVFDEYVRCYTNKTIVGACRHYRANATIDFETDTAEKDRQIATPLLVLWGTRGMPPTQE